MKFKTVLIEVIDHLLYCCATLHHYLTRLLINLRYLTQFCQVHNNIGVNVRPLSDLIGYAILCFLFLWHLVSAIRSLYLKFLVVPVAETDQPLELRLADYLHDVEVVQLDPSLCRFLLSVVRKDQVDLLSKKALLGV